MANLRVCSLVLLGLFSSATFLQSVEAQKTTLLFAFGDAFVDVGNALKTGNMTGRAWKAPYGISWPNKNGSPAGRYSDGKTQTDYIKDMLSLPVYPPPYLYSEGQDLSSGVNFAAAGSGVSVAFNPATSLGAQVDNFERLLQTGVYKSEELLNSLTIVSLIVDDYFAYFFETNEEFIVFTLRVVINGIETQLQRLYDLGLRNVMVSNIYNTDCSPAATINLKYATCIEPESDLYIKIHNNYLLGAVQSINALNYPSARFIVLDFHAAINKMLNEYKTIGFTDGLKPCCRPTTNTSVCGDVDAKTGKKMYTVCKKRDQAIFWDELRPTMSAWNYIFNLYANEPGYIHLADAPTLKQWLKINDGMEESAGAPSSPPNTTTAFGQLQVAMHSLLDSPDYSEALGLVRSIDFEAFLLGDNAQPVTVFVPFNGAVSNPFYKPFFNKAYAENKVNDVVLYHAVSGYYDLAAFKATQPSTLTTLSSLTLAMSYSAGGVFVGQDMQVQVVAPDLYKVPGQVAVHGIDHMLFPPGFY